MISVDKKKIKYLQGKPNTIIHFKMKMILLVGALVLAIIGVIGLFVDHFLSDTLEEQVGDRALSVAETVARIPELVHAFEQEDPASIINPIVTPIQQATGAEFIVVGNQEEIRYAHPNADKIGERMIGEDNEKALVYGQSYVSKAVGSLGSSLRAKVPVYLDGEIVGVVSVGFLVNDIRTIIESTNNYVWLVLFNIAIVAIIGAVLIASYIKKVLLGLEPEEIAHYYFQKETILQSTHEGILAVNQHGIVTMMNLAAERMLFDEATPPQQYEGKMLKDIVPAHRLVDYLQNENDEMDREMLLGKTVVFANKVPIYYENLLMGTVFTFRNKTEIDLLTKELKTVKQYTDALRAQTHEFSNKLFTILGLLQLDQQEKAIAYIQSESSLQKNWIHLLIRKVADPMVSGLLLGKLNQVHELGIDFTIEEGSRLASRLTEKQSEALLTAIGNFMDNAIDAVKNNPSADQKISISFTDIGNDILFEIEDSGAGVQDTDVHRIFEQGFSLKEGEHRGFGLALSKQLIERVNGHVFLEQGDLGGARFVLSIPKKAYERGVENE
ncbi:sensor histidine kinase [Sporosarcina sp. HYO08]|uniref:ATP-binding protein n=1 Tax=Sporosarcina sp. HYO08 TaxID=1759557 RepID=UPI0007960BB9|nr:sensor histidine kinase [Sporosarcina sp. HYO08]KXH81956.1 histidine kinase [Sporosarcina sp. HYO08]